MFSPKDYLYTIATRRKEYFTDLLAEEGIHLLEAEVLMFLHLNPDSNTLTDIINAKDFTKSHVSTAISHLENMGYLSKGTTEKNKKTIRLTLLPDSQPLIDRLFSCAEDFHNKALEGISKVEIDEIDRLLKKICSNLKEDN